MLHRPPPWTAHDGHARPHERGQAARGESSVRFSAMLALTAQAGIDNWPPEGKLAAAVLVMMAVGGLLSKLVDEVVSRD